jgi:hypothetical protein
VGRRSPRQGRSALSPLGFHLDPPPGPPPSDGSGPYTYEPCQDVDPMPDYENVLTD